VRSQKRRKYLQHQSINEPLGEDGNSRPIELKENGLGPLGEVEQNETIRLVRHAISQLPPDEREVMIFRDIEEYSYEEIAQLCNIPLGTVKSRLARARRLLRTTLDPILRR